MLRKAQALTSFWRANLLTRLAFVAIHWPYRLYSGGWQAVLWAQLIPIFVLGLLLGYLVRETNSPWPSIGTHILNNLISNIVVIG